MTIIPVEVLDPNDLDLLGDNVAEAIRIDLDNTGAMNRSLACLDIGPAEFDGED